MTLGLNNIIYSKTDYTYKLIPKSKSNLENNLSFKINTLAKKELSKSPGAPLEAFSYPALSRQRRQYDPGGAKELQLFAAISKHKKLLDTIHEIKDLLRGVDINHQDADGDTFLHAAVQEEHQDIVKLLVDEGADTTIQNKERKTALDLANELSSSSNKQKIIDLLLGLGTSNIGHGPNLGVPRVSPIIPEAYIASGLKHSLHGNIYQLKLLMLFLHRGLAKGYDFRLSTEWDAAEKFDDLVFKYQNQGQITYRFLQAKHKQDKNEKITIGDLFSTSKKGEFNLEKYFISYLRIKKNPVFQNGNLESFMICTNIDFEFSGVMQGQAKMLKKMHAGKNVRKEIFVKEINNNDIFFKDGGTRYELQNSNDLVAHLKQGSEVQKEIQGQNINIDKEIGDFLKKLVFAVDQPNEIALGKIIAWEMGEKFNLIDADFITDSFLNEILNWMKEKEGRFLSQKDGDQFFELINQKLDTLKITGPTSEYSQRLRNSGVVFESNLLTKIKYFLRPGQKQVLRLISTHGTRLSAIKVNQALMNDYSYQKEDSYIFLSLGSFLRLQNKVLNAFKTQGRGNLLIIECKNTVENLQELYVGLKNTINSNPHKKLILITEEDDVLADLFSSDSQIKNKCQEEHDTINGLTDLTSQSQDKILERRVHFQGRKTPLNLLIDNQKQIIDAEILSDLVNNYEIKIGKMVSKLTGIDRECYIERTFNHKGVDKEITDRIAIIAASPGVGKSTVLVHLAEQAKERNPSSWVVTINLIEHTQKLQKLVPGEIEGSFISVVAELMNVNTSLEKALLESYLSNPNKMILFFDGFNEISPAYKSQVIELLAALKKKSQVEKIWITTRLHMRNELESGLGMSSSYGLSLLSEDEQKQFLEKFFRRVLAESPIHEKRLEFCAKKLWDAFTGIVVDGEFTAVPLQLNMMAKIFQKEFKAFYHNPNQQEFSLSNSFNLANLYEEFIKYKFVSFERHLDVDTTKPQMSDLLDKNYRDSLKELQLLALYILFEKNMHYLPVNEDVSILPGSIGSIYFEADEDTDSLLFKADGIHHRSLKNDGDDTSLLFSRKREKKINELIEEIEGGKDYFGMIDSILNKRPNFIHVTFSEYLAAQEVMNMFQQQEGVIISEPQRKTLYKLLQQLLSFQGTEGVQFFFDTMAVKNQEYPLHAAVLRGDCVGIGEILEQKKASINALDILGRTALHLAVIYGYSDFVIELMDRKANINIRDRIFGEPIAYAFALQDLKMVRFLLDHGATLPNVSQEGYVIDAWCMLKIIKEEDTFLLQKLIDKYGYDELSKSTKSFELTLIGVAAKTNKHRIVEYLITNKLCDINSYSNLINHKTALHYAAQRDNFDSVKFLIRNKANIYAQTNFYGQLPIELVVSQDSKTYRLLSNINGLIRDFTNENLLDILQSMKEDEALDIIEVIKDDSGITIFHHAVSNDDKQVVGYLIDNRININMKDSIDRTPLFYAVEDDNIDMIKLLINNNADVNARDSSKRTPLHYAIENSNYGTVNLLLEKGADFNVVDGEGKTPLHYAVKQGNREMVRLLLEKGADFNVVDGEGKTPLHYAVKQGNREMVRLLLEKGADFNVVDGEGKTPLHYAVKRGNREIVELLLEKGADSNIHDYLGKTSLHYAVLPKKYNQGIVEALMRANADPNSRDLGQKTPLDIAEEKVSLYDVNILAIIRSLLTGGSPSKRRRIEAQLDQQKIFIKLEKDLKSDFPSIEITSVRQGLYLPSFEKRNSKIAGKCAAITRGFSQSLFLGKHKEFLSNLEVSAELYERLASGKQISQREEESIFSLSRIFDLFERQQDFPTNSLPPSLSPVRSVETREDLSIYVRQLKGDFAIHLSTSNHVIAIYRIGEIYSYFDSNLALVSNLRDVDQLMRVVKRSMELIGYEVLEEGFLVEPLDVIKANQGLSIGQKQSLTNLIQTERVLLSLQDQDLGPIDFKGQKLHRKTLYDMGAFYDEGVPLLIHSQMHDLVENLKSGKIKIKAREYLQKLRGRSKESIQEIVQATRLSFEGSTNEKKNAHAIRELLISEDGQKLNSYELNKILKTSIEGSLKTIPYYLEIARSRYSHPGRLINAAGGISLSRGIHGTLFALQQGDVLEFSLGSGEIAFSLFSQLIEDKVVKLSPQIIKQMKFGIHLTRGVGGLVSNPFDVIDLIRSSIDLSQAGKVSKVWRDAIASVTFSSVSITSSVVLAALSTTGVGTLVGLGIAIGQGFYSGFSMVAEFGKYRLTTKENTHLFLHTLFLQPIPERVEYIAARKEMVKSVVYQGWERVLNSHKIVAYAMGLGVTSTITYQENCRRKPSGVLGTEEVCEDVKKHVIESGRGVIDMFILQNEHRFSRMMPSNPSDEYHPLCMPECPQDDERYGHDCTYGTDYKTHRSRNIKYYCENAAIIGHTSRMELKRSRSRGEGELIFDLKLVNSGRVRANREWKNEFILAEGIANIYGGDHTFNRFTLTRSGFEGKIFGGKNSTNILDVSNLESEYISYEQGNVTLVEKDVGYTSSTRNITAFISKAGRGDKIHCADGENIFIDCKGGKDDDPDIITNCKQIVVYPNTEINCDDDIDHTLYVKPGVGSAKIRMNRGRASIFFTEVELLNDDHHMMYSQESNTLTLEIDLSDSSQKFTLHISNFFDKKNHVSNVVLIDKYNSSIEPIIDKDQREKELKIDTFVLRAETKLEPFNKAILDWYEGTYPSKKGHQIYGILKNLENGMARPYSIFGSSKSDVISLKDVGFAKAGEGEDIYSLLTEDIEEGPNFIEIDNQSEDKKLDILYISTPSKEAKVEGCNLQLYPQPNLHIQIKDYFLNDKHRHLALIDNEKVFVIPPTGGEESCNKVVEGIWEVSDIQPVQAIPFYSATSGQNFYSISEEQMNNHSVIAIDASLNQTSFYRNYDDLLLRENSVHKNASLIVNLQGFYRKKNMSLYFYPDNYRLDLTDVSRLAIDYQEAEKNVYESSVKEYLIDLHSESAVIDHALEAPKIGVLLLPNVAPENIVISANDHDLILSNSDHTLTLKNWHNSQNRLSMLKFDEELEVIGIEKFDLNQISEMISQINKADFSHAIKKNLETLNKKVLNGVLYLLIARNAESAVMGAHTCLGFDSVGQQQLFMASYQPYYNGTTLKRILCDNLGEAAKALIWLVARGWLLSDKALLTQCFSSLVGSNFIESLYARHAKDKNINKFDTLRFIGVTIRDSKETFEQNIMKDLGYIPQAQESMSRSSRNRRFASSEEPSSLLGSWWNKVGSLFSNPTISALSDHGVPLNKTNKDFAKERSLSEMIRGYDINGGLQLIDILLAKIGKRKIYTSTKDETISLQGAEARARDMMISFEQVLYRTATASGISVKNLDFDFREAQLSITKQIRNGQYSKIFQTLYVAGEKACPRLKQRDKFLNHLKFNLEKVLSGSV